jgi:hypothetical protein
LVSYRLVLVLVLAVGGEARNRGVHEDIGN